MWNRIQPFESSALPQFSHDVILGWEFLTSFKAVIACRRFELLLEEKYGEPCKLYVLDDVTIPACATKILDKYG